MTQCDKVDKDLPSALRDCHSQLDPAFVARRLYFGGVGLGIHPDALSSDHLALWADVAQSGPLSRE